MNTREFQFAIILAAVVLIIFRVYPKINVWRLTQPSAIRPFYLTIEPGSILGILGATIGGPIAGLILGLVAWNPLYRTEVWIIVKAVQFFTIGYLHKKIQPPYDILAIPLGVIISAPIHPTIVHYILYRQIFVQLFWGVNYVFQAIVTFIIYLLLRLLLPQVYSLVNPWKEHKLQIPFFSNSK